MINVYIAVGAKAPNEYFNHLLSQCSGGELKYGNITSEEDLRKNMKENCIPEEVFNMTHLNYEDFLDKRRKMMAEKIRGYYIGL